SLERPCDPPNPVPVKPGPAHTSARSPLMELIQQVALVSEVEQISPSQLSRASAALQKQLSRDFGPIWGVKATIDAFATLEDVPLTYWPILIQEDIHINAGGVH